MFRVLSRIRAALIATALACLCLAVSGCSVADHTSIDLPVSVMCYVSGRALATSTRITMPDGQVIVLPRGIGDGTALLVRVDTQALPAGIRPDDIGAAALSIPVSSRSSNAGSTSFGIYMLEPDPLQNNAPSSLLHGVVPEGAKPLSICSLTHDSVRKTRKYGPVTFTLPTIDSSVENMNFNITEAVKAWAGGAPNAGLKILQRGAPPVDAPIWQIDEDPSKGQTGPRVVVWVRRPEQMPAQ